MRGKFITLEGIEGSGKSTSLDTISQSLETLNIEFIVTKEPGGGPLGKDLRKMLLDKKTSISSEVELLLMMADRKNHIENIVEPSLEKGIWVISDRYLDSSYAYQGGGRQIEVSKIDILTELLKLPIPDLTLLFDLSPEIALQRAKKIKPIYKLMQTLPSWLYAHSNKFDNNCLHHAYLISGRKGVGKSLLANRLAMQVLCHSTESSLCGECHSCKLSDLENHPDFHTLKILPEKKLIGISQIHELRSKLYESAFLGKNKAIILPHLEKISLDGLNAFLKILEEPPDNTYFFLISDFLNQVPMTIQSRCLDIKINLPNLDESLERYNTYI